MPEQVLTFSIFRGIERGCTDKTCSAVLFGAIRLVDIAVLEPGNCFFRDSRASIVLDVEYCCCLLRFSRMVLITKCCDCNKAVEFLAQRDTEKRQSIHLVNVAKGK
jgi:hypothetical protein